MPPFKYLKSAATQIAEAFTPRGDSTMMITIKNTAAKTIPVGEQPVLWTGAPVTVGKPLFTYDAATGAVVVAQACRIQVRFFYQVKPPSTGAAWRLIIRISQQLDNARGFTGNQVSVLQTIADVQPGDTITAIVDNQSGATISAIPYVQDQLDIRVL